MLQLKKADLESMIGSVGGKFSDLHKSWLRAYRVWIGLDAREDQPVEDELDDLLNGACWEAT